MSVFDEQYRVVGVEADRLFIQGLQSGEVLTIVSPELLAPLSGEEYPIGKLITLSNPCDSLPN
jgi:hypothetical protein